MYQVLKRLKKIHVILILVSVLFIVGQVWLDLKIPDYMAELINIIKTEGSSTKDLFTPAIWMLFCAFGSLILAIITGYLLAKVATSFSKELRKDLFYKINDFNLEEIKKFKISSLIVRSTNDVINLQRFLSMGLQVIIKAPILAVWAVSKIYTKNLTWSIYTGLFVLFLLLIVSVVIILILPKTLRIQRLTDDLNKITRENITGIRVIKAFNAEDYQKNKFEDTNELVTNTNLFIAIATALFFPIIMFLMSALTLLIYYTGAKMIDTALMPEKIETFSNMIVFSAYATQVIMAFMMLVMIFIIYPRARVSANRVMEVLKEKITLKEGSFKGKTKLKSTVEFKNVSFKYPDANECLLSDINFKVEEGETIAIIGSTASGKSTLINLIPRLYDVTKGEVLVNGINVKNYKRKTLNKLISYVSQKPVIFKGTIKSNVAFGTPGLTSKKINSALKIAQAKQFVNKLKDKEKSFVSARGTNLSGGQKQRLSIARAIARNPEIFIFDDSFSALDYKTDLALRESLFKSNKGATKFIVAQRIGTIINADKIIVLDEGKIVGLGTHQELLKTNKIYKEIALAQLKEEELS